MKIYTEAATDVEYQVINIYNFGDVRNLSRTMVSEKATLINKELIMKSIMIAIIATVMFFANTAEARIEGMMLTKAEVVNTIMEVNPIAGPSEIDKCYDAMKNGGLYTISSSKVSIYCTKNELTRLFAQ